MSASGGGMSLLSFHLLVCHNLDDITLHVGGRWVEVTASFFKLEGIRTPYSYFN